MFQQVQHFWGQHPKEAWHYCRADLHVILVLLVGYTRIVRAGAITVRLNARCQRITSLGILGGMFATVAWSPETCLFVPVA